MNIHLSNNGQNLGVFTLPQVETMLKSGLISYFTMAWKEGELQWRPLKDLIGAPVPPPPPLPRTTTVPRAFPVPTEMHWVRRYFTPAGRIDRFTWSFCVTIYVLILGFVVDRFEDTKMPQAEFWLGLLFVLWFYFTIVTSGKRFHDLGLTAWLSPLVFAPFVLLYLAFFRGTKGANKYGPDPADVP